MLTSEIDKLLKFTPYERVPCVECTLKHLGIAWSLTGLSATSSQDVLLSRVVILLDEASNGYPNHRILAVGILAFMEPFTGDVFRAREIRRAINSGGPKNLLQAYPLLKDDEFLLLSADIIRSTRQAHLIEAQHESPIPLDINLPVPLLVAQVLDSQIS